MRTISFTLAAAILLLLSHAGLAQRIPKQGFGFTLGPNLHTQLETRPIANFGYAPGLGVGLGMAYRFPIAGHCSVMPTLSLPMLRYSSFNTEASFLAIHHYVDVAAQLGAMFRLDWGNVDKRKFWLSMGPKLVLPVRVWLQSIVKSDSGTSTTQGGTKLYPLVGAAELALGYHLPFAGRFHWTVEGFGIMYQLDPRSMSYPFKHMTVGLRAGMWLRNRSSES